MKVLKLLVVLIALVLDLVRGWWSRVSLYDRWFEGWVLRQRFDYNILVLFFYSVILVFMIYFWLLVRIVVRFFGLIGRMWRCLLADPVGWIIIVVIFPLIGFVYLVLIYLLFLFVIGFK